MSRNVWRPVGGGAVVPASGYCVVDSANPTVNTAAASAVALQSSTNDTFSTRKWLIKWERAIQLSTDGYPLYILGQSDGGALGGFQTYIRINSTGVAAAGLVVRVRNITDTFSVSDATYNTITIGDTVCDDAILTTYRANSMASEAGNIYAEQGAARGSYNSRTCQGLVNVNAKTLSTQKIYGSLVDVKPYTLEGSPSTIVANLAIKYLVATGACFVDYNFQTEDTP